MSCFFVFFAVESDSGSWGWQYFKTQAVFFQLKKSPLLFLFDNNGQSWTGARQNKTGHGIKSSFDFYFLMNRSSNFENRNNYKEEEKWGKRP